MIKKIRNYYNWGGRFLTDSFHVETEKLNQIEFDKSPLRSDVINFLLESLQRETTYLEIGVRDPSINFDKIKATTKYSVDPGLEFKENPVDFKVTSDAFFLSLQKNEILSSDIQFDVIFIDGLHLADQVDRDIENALKFLKSDGYIVLHDCNPPTEWHARETHHYTISPAGQNWNGTTWKAFLKARYREDIYSCCVDTDWGVGVLSKNKKLGQKPITQNPFYEFLVLHENRKDQMNLITFDMFKKLVQ